MPSKYQNVSDVATLVHHRGGTTLPGAPPQTERGRAVLLIHDAGGNGNCFADLMDELSATQSPVAFDMPGHGRSGGLDALESVEAMAAHGAGLLGQFGWTDVVVVGEGLGAAVALELALTTDLVAGLVLVGGAAVSFDCADEIEALAAITAGRARREFDRSGYGPDTDRSVYQKAFAEWVKTDPRATLGDRKAQQDWSLGDRGSSVTVPTLVVTGAHEEDTGSGQALVAALANGEHQVLAGAGRRGAIEQPAALAGLIADMVGRLPEAAR